MGIFRIRLHGRGRREAGQGHGERGHGPGPGRGRVATGRTPGSGRILAGTVSIGSSQLSGEKGKAGGMEYGARQFLDGQVAAIGKDGRRDGLGQRPQTRALDGGLGELGAGDEAAGPGEGKGILPPRRPLGLGSPVEVAMDGGLEVAGLVAAMDAHAWPGTGLHGVQAAGRGAQRRGQAQAGDGQAQQNRDYLGKDPHLGLPDLFPTGWGPAGAREKKRTCSRNISSPGQSCQGFFSGPRGANGPGQPGLDSSYPQIFLDKH